MGANSLMVLQPGSFTRGGTMQMARQASASPMVLQQFMQLLANLNQKVDALAVRTEQLPQVMQTQVMPIRAKPVESTEVQVRPVRSSQPEHGRRTKVNRSGLVDMFD